MERTYSGLHSTSVRHRGSPPSAGSTERNGSAKRSHADAGVFSQRQSGGGRIWHQARHCSRADRDRTTMAVGEERISACSGGLQPAALSTARCGPRRGRAGSLLRLWSGNTGSSHNSQYVADPYTFSHISHGIVLYGPASLILRQAQPGLRFLAVVAAECLWEIIENTSFVIDRTGSVTRDSDPRRPVSQRPDADSSDSGAEALAGRDMKKKPGPGRSGPGIAARIYAASASVLRERFHLHGGEARRADARGRIRAGIGEGRVDLDRVGILG